MKAVDGHYNAGLQIIVIGRNARISVKICPKTQ